MAVGFAVANKGVHEYNGRITSFLLLSCLVAATGGFIYGYDIGVSGGVTSMTPFLKKFFPKVERRMKEAKISNYCKYDNQLLTLFTSSLYLAGLIASFFTSHVTGAFGRKPSMLIGGASFLAGAALNGAAINIYMLIFGRVLLGVGVGFTNQAVPLYLSEMALPKYRGAIGTVFHLCLGIGHLSANLVNYGTQKIEGGWGWRVSLAVVAIPASLLTVGTLFLTETPNSFIQNNKSNHEKAKRMLQRIRGTENVQRELDDLIKASEFSRTLESPYQNILKQNYRPQFIMSLAIPFFHIMTGINVTGFYAPLLFRTIGMGENAALMSAVITGVAGSITSSISILIVDRVGRRFLLIIGGIVMCLSQMMVGGIMAAKLGDHGGLTKGYAYAVLVFICVYIAGFGLSWGPLGWLIPSEIFSLEIRSAGQSINVGINFLCIFLIGQNFLAMLCHLKSRVFFFFGGWVAVMTVFVYLLLPETKNIPMEQMEGIWREHWFWKRIVGGNKEVLGKMDG